MLKRIGIVILVVFIFLLMLWFTNSNPGNVTLDLAFGIVQPSIPLAFSVTFVIGWAFGLLCTSLFILDRVIDVYMKHYSNIILKDIYIYMLYIEDTLLYIYIYN